MIISDLNYLDVVCELSQVTGAYGDYIYGQDDTVMVDVGVNNGFDSSIFNSSSATGMTAFFDSKSQAIADVRYNYVATEATGLAVIRPTGSFSRASGYAAIRSISSLA
jgi:hypothetical protein